MKTFKLIFGLLLGAAILGGIGGTAVYFSLELRERKLDNDFQLSRSLHDQGDFERSEQAISGHIDAAKGTEAWLNEALILRFRAQNGSKNEAAATATAERIIAMGESAGPERLAECHAYLGSVAIKREDVSAAQSHFEAVIRHSGVSGHNADAARLGLARIRLALTGATPEVREELATLRTDFPSTPLIRDIEHVLGQCNMALMFSEIPVAGDLIYEVASGDTINALARKHGIAEGLLMAVNRIDDPRRLSIGRRIKIPDVHFSIEVNKTDNSLQLLNNGRFFKHYPVRTGRVDYLTPVGEFKIRVKKKNPAWNDPKTGRYFPPNDAENQLGSRWIGFKGSSFGIHGTIEPDTIGTYASNGCVGMLKEDVEELYDLVTVGTPIRIFGTAAVEPRA